MAIAAVPRYLGEDFSTAAPGHRFGMYLKLWGIESRSREALWTTHDVNYRTAGQQREERSFKDENKTPALKEALKLTDADKHSMKALADRQKALATVLASSGQLLRLEAKAVAPFSTGLGNEHPLENGFAFLNPYGLPYLPGSGVKGVLRQAARELVRGDWGGTQGWDEGSITALFGREGDDGDTDHQRGALSFWDVIPQLAGDALKVEVMTPHQTHYYDAKKGESPHESGSPNPINFLAVPPESGFAFHVQCNRPFLQRLAPELVEGNRWQMLIRSALELAFEWLGFGAKTAVGYGAMQLDKEAERARVQEQNRRIEDERKRVVAAGREAQLAALSPVDRKMEEARASKQDGQSDDGAIFKAMKDGAFAGDELREAATKLRALMLAAKSWKESTAAKKPEKDKEHQRTLEVMKWLKG